MNHLTKDWQTIIEAYELPPLPEKVIDRAGLLVDINEDQWKINDATSPSMNLEGL